jgi:hypothetical protein
VAAVAAGAKAAAHAAAPVKVVATRIVFAIADFLPDFMTRALSIRCCVLI